MKAPETGAEAGAYADVVALLDRLGAGGVEVALDGDGLSVAPWPEVAEDDRQALRDLRDRIVEHLAADRQALRAPRAFGGGWRGRPDRRAAPEVEVEKPAPPPARKLLAGDLTEAERRAIRDNRPGLVLSPSGVYSEVVPRPGGRPLNEVKNLRIKAIIQQRK